MAPEDEKRESQQISGVSNVAYDLMAVLTSKLEGIAAMEEYRQDAQDAGDQEAEQLFERLQQNEAQAVTQLKQMVQSRLS